ncbi:hypothetical protein DCC26_01145 [Auritidibacter sp. NML120779]|nr:hypothetical protein DCC26_01145 [Auritidibacter sp. NML120779]
MPSRRSARRAHQHSQDTQPTTQRAQPDEIGSTSRISPTMLGLILMAVIGALLLITTAVLKLISDHFSPFIVALGILLILIPAGYGLWRVVTARNTRAPQENSR